MKTPSSPLPTGGLLHLAPGRFLAWLALLVMAASAATAATLYRNDRLLVKPRPGLSLDLLHLQMGAVKLRTLPALGGLQVVRVPAGSPIGTLVELYRRSGLVEYAEPDYFVRALREPDDFRFWDGSLWGLKNTGQLGGTPGADIQAPDGWELQYTAEDIVVAVVDTGLRATHEDLAANLWTNPGESGLDALNRPRATNGVDDDGNGYVDDVHGVDFITGSGHPVDDYGHGSHVAGIIGAVGNNAVGVVGVAWRAQLMDCKFIDAQGNGAISDAIAAIDYARRQRARIINASWGDTGFNSQALHDAIAAARDAGILFVAAAGNSAGDNDVTPLYPASFDLDNIIAVTATNRNDGLAFFAHRGATSVDLGAPGEDIFSVWAGSDSDYRFSSGTSMSAAYVSGAAAVLMAQAGNQDYARIRQRILAGTEPLLALQGKTVTGGRLNLLLALQAGAEPPPAAPSDLTAEVAGATSIRLSWADRSDNELGFEIERAEGAGEMARIAVVAADTTAHTDGSLRPGATYRYRVRAFNRTGASDYSNQATATLPEEPAPFTVSVTATDAEAAEGGGTGAFQVTRSGQGPLATLTVAYAMSGTAGNGTDYETLAGTVVIPEGATAATVILRPINDAIAEDMETAVLTLEARPEYRVGEPSAATVTVADNDGTSPPAAPSGLTAEVVGTTAVRLAWTDASDNEDEFEIERAADGGEFTRIAAVAAGTTSHTDSGLEPGATYRYRVRARNAAGASAYSNTASATLPPAQPPAVPTVSVVASDPLAGEAGADPGAFTLQRAGDTSRPVLVRFTLGGSATNGVDYERIDGTATIPAGQASVVVKILSIDDGSMELPETVVLQLTPDPGYQVGRPDSGAIVLLDNDLPKLP